MKNSEREHMNRVAAMGCIACRMDGRPGTPAHLHHIRETVGMGQRASNMDVLPLCPSHHVGTMHRPGRDGHVPSIHLDRRAFIAEYGTELELLAMVQSDER